MIRSYHRNVAIWVVCLATTASAQTPASAPPRAGQPASTTVPNTHTLHPAPVLPATQVQAVPRPPLGGGRAPNGGGATSVTGLPLTQPPKCCQPKK
jgi:hypothetical protein